MTDERDYAWMGDLGPMCLTFISGLSLEEVKALIGADPASARVATFEQAEADQDFVAERFAVQLGTTEGWVVAVEPNGYVCIQDAALAALSVAGTAVSIYWSVNTDARFAVARGGILVRALDPVLGQGLVGDPLPEEGRQGFEDPIASCLAVAEELTGVVITQDWLMPGPRETVTCPLAT